MSTVSDGIHVASLRLNNFIKKTINDEIKGSEGRLFGRTYFDIVLQYWHTFSSLSWRIDSSDVILPILPKMELAARWKARLAWSRQL